MTTITPASRRGGWRPTAFGRGTPRAEGRRLGFQPIAIGKGHILTRRQQHPGITPPTDGPKGRPAWLGLPLPARLVERVAEGYAAFITDAFGSRTSVGIFADMAAALAAARTAYDQVAQ